MRFGCDSDTDSNRAMRTACETSKAQILPNKDPFFVTRFSLLVVRIRSCKCLNEGNSTVRFVWQFHAAISCAQGALGRRTESRQNFLRCGIASEALRRNMPLRFKLKAVLDTVCLDDSLNLSVLVLWANMPQMHQTTKMLAMNQGRKTA